jgi:hypothetical protein
MTWGASSCPEVRFDFDRLKSWRTAVRHSKFRNLACAIVLATLSGCGGGESGTADGRVSVALTDAPVDVAQEVWIKVTGVAFKPDGDAPEIVQDFEPRSLDLLRYQQGDVAVLLDDVPFKAGHYQWLRLLIESEPNVRDSYVMVDGAECELRVPSGAESGLKMNRGFTIPADGSLALTVDFDLRQSLHAPPGQQSGTSQSCTQGYLLRPTLRLVDDAHVGAIEGTVSFEAGAVPDGCLPKVYVFDSTAIPDDVEESNSNGDVDPVTVADVELPTGALEGTYHAAFIPEGDYVAAFTCSDDTEEDEDLVFVPEEGSPVSVQNNLISTLDFLVPAAN